MTAASLAARLWSKVDIANDDDACWPWKAAVSIGGQRCVPYGVLRVTRPTRRLWRVNRLVLVLTLGEDALPAREGETFADWLDRAFDAFRDVEASHTCDNSACCNPSHLEWRTHVDNVVDQATRRADARERIAA